MATRRSRVESIKQRQVFRRKQRLARQPCCAQSGGQSLAKILDTIVPDYLGWLAH